MNSNLILSSLYYIHTEKPFIYIQARLPDTNVRENNFLCEKLFIYKFYLRYY